MDSDLFVIERNNKYGFANKNGDVVIPFVYDFIDNNFIEGLACVKKDEKLGFVNQEGEEVVPCKYDNAGWFHEGLACVKKDGKWGFINNKGEMVIRCDYDFVYNFVNGITCVRKNSEFFYITKQNKVISKKERDIFYYVINNMFDSINLSDFNTKEELSALNETVAEIVVDCYKYKINNADDVNRIDPIAEECKQRLQSFAYKISDRQKEIDRESKTNQNGIQEIKSTAFNKLDRLLKNTGEEFE